MSPQLFTINGEPVTYKDVLDAEKHRQFNRIDQFYPDTGPARRELYVKHLAFFGAGVKYQERAAIAANRVGKTEGLGAYEITCHATGRYPDWWPGKRFDHPVQVWACGKTGETTRTIVQGKLLGKIDREKGDDPREPMGLGTGMIPADCIGATRARSGVPNAIETAWIKHITGKWSQISFKSYEQGRGAFEGSEIDVVWMDEEPEQAVYNEALVRTMATGQFQGGICLLTFTPLAGWSDVVDSFLDEKAAGDADRFCITIGWDDAPHLSKVEKEKMARKFPPHELEARSKGIPRLGSGAIYPIDEKLIKVEPFRIPEHWPRGYALDVGLHTAAMWIAHDRDNDELYAYAEYYRDEGDIAVHAAAIKAKGDWIPGFIDPSANNRSQTDGQRVIELYRRAGLHVNNAENAVEAGLWEVWQRMTSNRLKVFSTLSKFWAEFRLYRRDEKGKIVKKNDHMMDAGRYCVMGVRQFRTRPAPQQHGPDQGPVPSGGYSPHSASGSWMG